MIASLSSALAALLVLASAPAASAQAGLCKWCPRVVPTWPATWSIANSTIVMPCNSTGLLTPDGLKGWSVVDVDWSNAKSMWVQGKPMDSEMLLLRQAEDIAAALPSTKTLVYRNIVIAYPWMVSVREKLIDPAFADWFIKFAPLPKNGSYHVPQCDDNYNPPLCTPFYHSQDQTPGYPRGDGVCPAPACDCGGVPCGFYLFNHANESLRDWLINDFVMGPTGVGSPAVHGVYLDDHWANASDPTDAPDCASSPIGGPTEVNVGCIADTGLTQAQTTAITDAWRVTMLQLQRRLIDAGAFSWAYFTEYAGGAPGPSQALCKAFFRNNTLYDLALMMGLAQPMTDASILRDVASFLLARGPYAWIGHGWQGCPAAGPGAPPAQLLADYGVPLDNVTESGNGVFTRHWSKATVQMDCEAWVGSIVWV